MSDNLYILLPKNELDQLSRKVPKGHTPLWLHWPEFVKRYTRLGRSHSTVQNVKDALLWMIRHLNILSIEQCFDILDIEDRFHKYKEDRGNQGSTFNSYRKNVNTYFIWLKRYRFIKENPIHNIPKCHEQYQSKHIQTKGQIDQMLALLSTQRSTSLERSRNILLIQILRITGARPKEIIQIRMDDIVPMGDTHKLTIRGIKQGGKLRPYRMKGALKDAYENYMHLRQKSRMNEPWLFISRRHGKPFGIKGMRYLFRNMSEKLKFKITAYGFRRYVATTLYKQGHPIDKISNHLGHADIRTTKSYIDDLCDWTDEGVDILMQ